MDRQKVFTVLIAVVALATAVYALVSVNQSQRDASAPAEPKTLQRIQTAGSGITITQNRLGGAGAVELRRDNRIDLFGGLDDLVMVPVDYFDLSPIDEDAADKLITGRTCYCAAIPTVYSTVEGKRTIDCACTGEFLSIKRIRCGAYFQPFRRTKFNFRRVGGARFGCYIHVAEWSGKTVGPVWLWH